GAHAITDNGNAVRTHGLHVHEPVANAIRDCNYVRCAPWQVAVEEATYQALNASARVCSVRWQLGRQQRVRVIHDRYARELRPGNEETLVVVRMDYVEWPRPKQLAQFPVEEGVQQEELLVGRSRCHATVTAHVGNAVHLHARVLHGASEMVRHYVNLMPATHQRFCHALDSHRSTSRVWKRTGCNHRDAQRATIGWPARNILHHLAWFRGE